MAASPDGLTLRKITRLLQYHEHAADALRTTLALMNGEAVAAKQETRAPLLATALALDRARTQRSPVPPKKDRAKTAHFLALFDPVKPLTSADVMTKTGRTGRAYGLPSLIHHGYLKRKGAGWVRTSKPYDVHPPKTT